MYTTRLASYPPVWLSPYLSYHATVLTPETIPENENLYGEIITIRH